MSERTLHLNINLHGNGSHPAAWRLPQATPNAFFDAKHMVRIATIAERGLFDAVFFADNSFLRAGGYPNNAVDPLVSLTAIAAATERIGLIATVSTTFHHPYTIARAFSSIDHFSGGRVGWNVVTTRNRPAGHNYGYTELPDRASRYERALESVQVVTGLWDSWAPGALVLDQESGVAVDAGRITAIDHVGRHFSVAGPGQLPPTPQGRPVIVQAGGSQGGLDLAARYADVVFTSQLFLAEARTYYAELDAAAVAHGRPSGSIAVLPGLNPILGSTEAEARARIAEFDELLGDPAGPLTRFAEWIGVPADELDVSKPFPLELLTPTGDTYSSIGFDTSIRLYLERNQHRTVGDLLRDGRQGHRNAIGTPEQIADTIEEWFRTGAADGFNLGFDALPDGLEVFIDTVVPILQERGIFRREYRETTLRERLGLPDPASGIVVPPETAETTIRESA